MDVTYESISKILYSEEAGNVSIYSAQSSSFHVCGELKKILVRNVKQPTFSIKIGQDKLLVSLMSCVFFSLRLLTY